MQEDFSIQELSDSTGVSVRQIRSYIQQDLIPGPSTLGPKSRYEIDHLRRLKAIRRLREIDGLSVADVRRVLTTSTPEEIELLGQSPLATEDAQISSARSYKARYGRSAAEYARQVRLGSAQEDSNSEIQYSRVEPSVVQRTSRSDHEPGGSLRDRLRIRRRHEEKPGSVSTFTRLLGALRVVTGDRTIRRKSSSAPWVRIQVTPDIELHVRSELADSERANLELIADYMREALTGGE